MSLAAKYRKSEKTAWSMRWKTTHPDGDTYDGVVVDIKRRYILLREESSYSFDGLIVLPKKSLKGYRDGPLDACTNEVLRSCGAFNKLTYPAWMTACQNLASLIHGLKARDIWPGVEILVDDGKDYDFYLGQITEVGAKEFRLMCYDARGEWEREFAVAYDEVFRLEINSQYCNKFNDFMRTRPNTA